MMLLPDSWHLGWLSESKLVHMILVSDVPGLASTGVNEMFTLLTFMCCSLCLKKHLCKYVNLLYLYHLPC